MSYKATAWAYELHISSPMKPVLVVLADMADEAATCYPGQARIAQMTGLSTKTVARALKKLERLGLVVRQHRQDGFGHRTSDRYHLQLTVTVPESLPDTLPTRQRAYKATSPSLTDSQSLPNGHSVRGITRESLENHQGDAPKSPTCGKHPRGTDQKCRACGDARRAYDAAAKAGKPIMLPPRVGEPEYPEHEHRWTKDGTCMHCPERRTA